MRLVGALVRETPEELDWWEGDGLELLVNARESVMRNLSLREYCKRPEGLVQGPTGKYSPTLFSVSNYNAVIYF